MTDEPTNGLPPGVKIYAQPLNVGAQPVMIDSSADTSQSQVAIVTRDGTIGVMNMGTFIAKIVDFMTADNATTSELSDAINKTQSAINAQKEATDEAIQDVNNKISGQGTDLAATINAVKSEADANKAALDTLTPQVSANTAAITKTSGDLAAYEKTTDAALAAMQAQIDALTPIPHT